MVQALPLIFCLICPTLPDIMGIGYVQPQAAFCFLRLKGGFRPFNFENTISTYGWGVVAWTCTNNLRVVLGPCVQYCPSEASEQRMGQKPKT